MEIITWNQYSIKQILLDHREEFAKLNWHLIRDVSFEAVNNVLLCWSDALWFASFKCNECNHIKHIPFTCKSRFCNSCWKPQSDLRLNRLVSRRPQHIPYFHFVFTIPEELRPFFKLYRSALTLLQKSAYNTLLFYFNWNKYYKSKNKWKKKKAIIKNKCIPWIVSVIHSFWAKLNRNPHVHFLLTAWWITPSWTFKRINFLTFPGIIASWKFWLLKLLRKRIRSNIHPSKQQKRIDIINFLYSQKNNEWNDKSWYVYFSPKTSSFKTVLSYIWRYLKRPVIAQSRIIQYDWHNVTFSYLDKIDNEKKEISCSALDFIWFLIQHIPNKNFKLINYHWIFANRCKTKYLQVLNSPIQPFPYYYRDRIFLLTWKDPFSCSCWWLFSRHSISIPWYPTKFFDSS